MALKVWLPLNGSLENQGISENFSWALNAFTSNANGKIGPCYKGNGVIHLNSELLDNKWSCALWINEPSAWSQYNQILICKNNSASTDCQLYFSIINGSQLNVGINGPASTGTYSYNFALNTWYHVAATYDGTTYCLYINGEMVKTGTCTTAFAADKMNLGIGCRSANTNGTSGTGQTSTQLLNDVRIYDHCLSTKEIKEISQGLILHYKLDGFNGGVGENILTNSTGNLGNTAGWNGLVTRAEENGNSYLIAKRTDTTTTTRTFCTHTAITSLVSSWAPGDKFTISGYYKVPSNETYAVGGNMFIRWTYTSGGSFADTGFTTPTSLTKDTWIYFANTYTVPSSYVDGPVNFYLSAFSTGLSTIYWKNIKLEKGETATAWSPTLAEMGIDTAQVCDSSGYGNNGTILGAVTTEVNESNGRYSISSKFSDNADSITISPCFSVGQTQTEMTTSIWAKTNTLNDTSPNLMSLGENSFWRFRLTSSSSVWWYIRIGNAQCSAAYSISEKNLLDNNWHHYAVTFKNGIIIFYVDGVQIGTTDQSSSATYVTCNSAGSTWHLAGYRATSEKFIGNLADARIYATALSAEDILDLYHTSANIDNLGAIHSFEFVEDTNSRELLALPWTSRYSIHNKTSLTTKYNEKGELNFSDSDSGVSVGSDYIKINPTGKTYYYDMILSITAGNQFYVGFERYDADKTSRSNQACAYVYATKPSTDIVYQRFFGTVNLATDGVNPTDTIALRILNGWGSSSTSSTATVHRLSLREVSGSPQTQCIKQNGQLYTDTIRDRDDIAHFNQNGIADGVLMIEK